MANPSSVLNKPSRVAAAIAVVAALVVAPLALTTPAVAADGDTVLLVEIEQKDGIADSPGVFDAQGLDANDSNSIVRTNDTISYKINVRNELGTPGPDSGDATNLELRFTLPRGQELQMPLPNYCLAGSSVTPESLGDLAQPLTSTSWLSFVPQEVVCVLADRTNPSESFDYTFNAIARSEVPNGTLMDELTATATADQDSTGDTTDPVSVTVVSRPDYDLSKNGMQYDSNPNTAFVDQRTGPCTNPDYEVASLIGCQILRFPIIISVQQGGKGATPLGEPITFVDDISPEAFWGAGVLADPDYSTDLAPSLVGCGSVTEVDNGGSFYPYGTLTAVAATTTNSVRESGTFSCLQAGGDVAVTITGTDTTARTVPTTNGTYNVGVPAGRALVVSGWISVEFPVAAIDALGVAGGDGQFTLGFNNAFTEFGSTTIGGQDLPEEEAVTLNNSRNGTARVEVAGTFSKVFTGEPGNPANSGGSGYSAGSFAGPAGSGDGRDGNGIVQAGGKVTSLLSRNVLSPPGFGSVRQVTCDAWDNDMLALTAAQWRGVQAGIDPVASPAAAPPTVGYYQYMPSNGAAVWLTSGDPVSFTVEYSAGTPGTALVNDCLSSTTGWFTDPADLPGNDPTLEAQGIYTGVSAVRISYDVSKESLEEDLAELHNFGIGFTVLDSVEAGDVIGNWGSSKTVFSDDEDAPTLAEALAATAPSPDVQQRLSNYAKAGHTGVPGDRITVQTVTARVDKRVWNPGTNDYANAVTPVYPAGGEVQYSLRPSLTAGVSTGLTHDTYVEDCLPLHQTFASSTLEGGGAILPVISDGAPDAGALACPTGRTYLRWNLGELPVNTVLPAVLYTVEVSATAPNGTLTNTALITADGDTSSAAARTDTAQMTVQTPTGIAIAKTTLKPVVEVSGEASAIVENLEWAIQFAAIDTNGVSDVEVIDLLPADGLGGTAFAGTLEFSGVAATSSTAGAVTYLYTSAPTAQVSTDPKAASNLVAGTTVWCDAVSGGTAQLGTGSPCPTGAATVTAVRVLVAGAFPAGSTLDIDIDMTAHGNSEGDVYNNSTGGNANGVLQGVGPAQRAIEVVASSIGDYVWLDEDRDGLNDEGEPPVEGMPVSLSGTDHLGNTITRTTTTDASGNYLFDNLPSGEYTVTFDKAWADERYYAFTTPDVGDDPTINSKPAPASGVAPTVTLAPNTDILDVDAGLVFNGPVSIDIEKEVCTLADNSCAPDAALGTGGWATDGVPGVGPDSEAAHIILGHDVLWRIIVTNTGQETLTDVAVTDVDEPLGDRDASDFPEFDALEPGESVSWTFTTLDLLEDIAPNTAEVIGYSLDDPTIDVTDEDTASALVAVADLSIRKVIDDSDTTDDRGDAETFPAAVDCVLPDESVLTLDIDLPRDGTPVVIEVPVDSVCTVVETDTDGGEVSYSLTGDIEITTDTEVVVTNTYESVISPLLPVTPQTLALTGLSISGFGVLAGGLLVAGVLLRRRWTVKSTEEV